MTEQPTVVDDSTGQRSGAAKLLEWTRRYGLAEVLGIVGAIAAATASRHISSSNVAAAYAGAIGETIGYAGAMLARDVLTASRSAQASGRTLDTRDHGNVVLGLLAEFGPAGILDTFVTRPLAMGLGAQWLGPRVGLVVGKLVGDVLFYVPVIVTYEWRRHRPGN